MKNAPTFLKALTASLIAFLPLQADAKPKDDEKKREAATAEAQKSAPKKAAPRASSKAPSRPKPQVTKAPSRPKPQITKARSQPKPQASKAPSRPKPQISRAPAQRKPQISKAPARPKPQISRAPAQTKPQITKAPDRSKPQVSKAPKRAPAIAQQPQRRPSSVSPSVAERRKAPEKVKPESTRAETSQPGPRREATAQAKERLERAKRDTARSKTAQPPKAKETPEPAVAAQPAERADRARPGERPKDREERKEPQSTAQTPQKPRDLTATAREKDSQRRVDRDRDRDRAPRIREQVDRRPPAADSPEERKLRTARAEVRERVSKERKREVAQRQERLRSRVQQFREARPRRIAAVREQRQILRAAPVSVRQETVVEARSELRNYWRDRGDDIRYRVEDRHDHLFNDDWWERRHWRDRHVHVNHPWWWWQPARWATVNIFLDAGWHEPVIYDYGVDVIYDDRVVYVRGEPMGTPVEYSRRVIELANPEVAVVAEAPVVEDEWTPLGVWALVQEDQGDAVMFFQLSVNQSGVISGAYVNVVSGEELPVTGQVDRATQRVAWHIGEKTEKVFETGIANLEEDQASCLVHLAPGEMQPWLLVRMEGPDLPDQPADVSGARRPAASAALNP